jgi:hypothetical protein
MHDNWPHLTPRIFKLYTDNSTTRLVASSLLKVVAQAFNYDDARLLMPNLAGNDRKLLHCGRFVKCCRDSSEYTFFISSLPYLAPLWSIKNPKDSCVWKPLDPKPFEKKTISPFQCTDFYRIPSEIGGVASCKVLQRQWQIQRLPYPVALDAHLVNTATSFRWSFGGRCYQL